MANWGKILARGHVEDRRGLAPAVGGIGLGGVALLFLINVISGGSPEDFLNQINSAAVEPQNLSQTQFAGEDGYEIFASTVLGSANETWSGIFSKLNKNYEPPRLVLFRIATESACGIAASTVGPHYCPLDKTIYLDETFFDELRLRFGAKGGDVAEAYVIAHEVAHHAQNELGIFDLVGSDKSKGTSVKLELQADCFAGLWANSIRNAGVFEKNEIHEAMDAAAAVGDDRIQQKVTGQINPESFTHGSSAERVMWFDRGYERGDFSQCDTFN